MDPAVQPSDNGGLAGYTQDMAPDAHREDHVGAVAAPSAEDYLKAWSGLPKTVIFLPLSIYVNAAFCAPLPFKHGEGG
jgi:hypothetical protein